jgi:hypothetical protein
MDTATHSSPGLWSPSIFLFNILEDIPKTASAASLEIDIELGSDRHNGGRSERAGNSYAEESASLR